jgi:hypothetical protein
MSQSEIHIQSHFLNVSPTRQVGILKGDLLNYLSIKCAGNS